MNAGAIHCIPLQKNIAPGAGLANLAKVLPDFNMVRVEARVLNCELTHVWQPPLRTIELLGEAIVLKNDFALLMQCRRSGKWAPGSECTHLRENPRVSNCTASDGYAVNARVLNHVNACLCREQVAAAEHHAIRRQLL